MHPLVESAVRMGRRLHPSPCGDHSNLTIWQMGAPEPVTRPLPTPGNQFSSLAGGPATLMPENAQSWALIVGSGRIKPEAR